MRGVFVTGTGTGVGKTVLSAAIMWRYRRDVPLRYWKPVQTGIEQDDDTGEVARLGGLEESEILADGVRLRDPVSPHLAARRSGARIAVEDLLGAAGSRNGRALVVEGAGGVLVPINESETMADLMAGLGLSAAVAARSGLGTINHTLLTVEALRARSIPVAGVVMIGEPDRDNREAIECYGSVEVLGEMPRFDPLTPEGLRDWSERYLDPEGILLDHLRP